MQTHSKIHIDTQTYIETHKITDTHADTHKYTHKHKQIQDCNPNMHPAHKHTAYNMVPISKML